MILEVKIKRGFAIFFMTQKSQENNNQGLVEKPPVVVVLGHVDHGKTSLLDYIRKTKIAAKESGGITQHIGAYQIEWQDKKITFIDTPGHEAFSSMRSRGIQAADIALLIVAADDGVKPQTIEAINYIKKSGIAPIVVINKIDLPTSQPEKIKQELLEQGIAVENYGGDIPIVQTSAKTGEGINDLLEIILLVAEMQELKFNSQARAKGVIIEASLDKKRGIVATLLIQDGRLTPGEIISSSLSYGKIKRIIDFAEQNLNEASAGSAVEVMGFNNVPMAGDSWSVVDDLKEAEEKIIKPSSQISSFNQKPSPEKSEKIVLEVILKSDFLGTLEAVKNILNELKEEKVELKILSSGVGEINENDVKLAAIKQTKILGFRVSPNLAAQRASERYKIDFIITETIYELTQKVRELLSSLVESEEIKELSGELKALAVFKSTKNGQIIGGRVISGKVIRGNKAEILRNEEYIGEGKIVELQHNKKPVSEVVNGQECGILYQGEGKIEIGDIIKSYQISIK